MEESLIYSSDTTQPVMDWADLTECSQGVNDEEKPDVAETYVGAGSPAQISVEDDPESRTAVITHTPSSSEDIVLIRR